MITLSAADGRTTSGTRLLIRCTCDIAKHTESESNREEKTGRLEWGTFYKATGLDSKNVHVVRNTKRWRYSLRTRPRAVLSTTGKRCTWPSLLGDIRPVLIPSAVRTGCAHVTVLALKDSWGGGVSRSPRLTVTRFSKKGLWHTCRCGKALNDAPGQRLYKWPLYHFFNFIAKFKEIFPLKKAQGAHSLTWSGQI